MCSYLLALNPWIHHQTATVANLHVGITCASPVKVHACRKIKSFKNTILQYCFKMIESRA